MPLERGSAYTCKKDCTAVTKVWEGVDLKEDFKD